VPRSSLLITTYGKLLVRITVGKPTFLYFATLYREAFATSAQFLCSWCYLGAAIACILAGVAARKPVTARSAQRLALLQTRYRSTCSPEHDV